MFERNVAAYPVPGISYPVVLKAICMVVKMILPRRALSDVASDRCSWSVRRSACEPSTSVRKSPQSLMVYLKTILKTARRRARSLCRCSWREPFLPGSSGPLTTAPFLRRSVPRQGRERPQDLAYELNSSQSSTVLPANVQVTYAHGEVPEQCWTYWSNAHQSEERIS
jgi:hypothetical protein